MPPLYDIQVRMNGQWHGWVRRKRLANARLAKRQLALAIGRPDAWWDGVRIRINLNY